MFLLRDEHLEALGRAKLEEFKDRLAAHLGGLFPGQVQTLGPAGLREAIEGGMERARGHALETERDICGYLELMFRFGRDFDSDPALPFADRILQERMVYERPPRLARLRELQEQALADAGELGYQHRHGGRDA